MIRLIRLALLLSVAGWPSVLFAQDTLTLSQAIQEMLAHNRSLQSAQASVRETDARVWQTRSAYFPRVSVTESWQRGDQPVFVFSSLLSSRRFAAANFAIDSLNAPDPTGFFRAGLSIEQVLFDGGRTRAAVASAQLQRDVAKLSADDAAAGLVVAVTDAYGRALAAGASKRSADAAVAAAQEDLTRATLRRDAGTLNDADVLAIGVHLAEVRERSLQAAGDEAVAKAELNRLMGSPIDRQYVTQEPVTAASASRDAQTVAAHFAEAETTRPELKRAAAAEQIADAGRRQARSAWYPQVVAQAGVEASGIRISDRASSWLIGGELRWSFSAGGAELAQRTAALEAVSRARAQREDARAAVQVEIVTARQRLESARARQAVAQQAVAQARESERIIRDRFDAGIAGTNDVLRAASAVLDAETRRTSALVDALISSAMLDRAIGRMP